MGKMPEIDVSRMFEHPKCAIRCRTFEDANALCNSVLNRDPKMAGHFGDMYTAWDYGGRTCYTLFYSTSLSPQGLSRTNVEWFLENGYEVIEFSDLASFSDPDIEESDQSIDVLLNLNS